MILHSRLLGAIAVAAASSVAPAQWWQAAPAVSPSPRGGCAMAGSPQGWGAPVVMYSGLGPGVLDDTWTYNGSDWTQLLTSTNVAGVVTPNSGPFLARSEMDYENGFGDIVLFGGGSFHPLMGLIHKQETWTFDPFAAVWTKRFPAQAPDARSDFGCAFVPNVGVGGLGTVVVFGGDNGSFSHAAPQTWGYSRAQNSWTLLNNGLPAAGPNPGERSLLAMCRGPQVGFIHQVLCFGGINWNTGVADNALWAFSVPSGSWTMVDPGGAGAPPARVGARMYFDTARGVAVLHGGHDGLGPVNFGDTWEWNGSAWTQVAAPDTSLHVRAGVAFDDAGRIGVQFGGEHPVTGAPSGATFHYGAKGVAYGQGCPGTLGVPTLTVAAVPKVGGTYRLNVNNTLAGAVGLHVVGFQNATSSIGALPLALDLVLGLGASCQLLVADDALFAGPAGINAFVWGPLPAAGFGLPLYSQFAVLDAGAPGLLAMTNAVAAMIGL